MFEKGKDEAIAMFLSILWLSKENGRCIHERLSSQSHFVAEKGKIKMTNRMWFSVHFCFTTKTST